MSGLFGYSHLTGGYSGGQAEYVRVPYADVGPELIPAEMHPDDAVLLTDVVPTGYQAAEMGGMEDMIFNSRWFMRGVYCYKGYLTNAHVARKFNLKHKDLNLFMAARF